MHKENTKISILDDPNLNLKQLQEQIVGEIKAGKSLLGQGGLIKSALEAALEGEMEAHLGCLAKSSVNAH